MRRPAVVNVAAALIVEAVAIVGAVVAAAGADDDGEFHEPLEQSHGR